jgi:hypothetical protein
MADKTLGVVALTVNGKTEMMSVKDADATKARYAASKTPFTERLVCPVGKPAVITAEEGVALHAVAGMAESPQELAALVSPQSKRFAVYEPMDRFALRAKPVMDQLEKLATNFSAVMLHVRASGGLTQETCTEAIGSLDKILDLLKRNPEFFDPDDSKEPAEFRAHLVGLLKASRGM